MNTAPHTGKRIWLTGASSGIGAALAEELLARGHRLALSARRREPLDALAARWPQQVLVVPGDLTEPDAVAAIAARIDAEWGALDMAILNAGTCEYVEVRAFEAAMVERVVSANLFSAAHCVAAALPLLRKGDQPLLAGVASAATFLALPRAEAYGASKAALRYLLESLRVDLAAEGIAVSVISPGFVDTPLTRRNDFAMPMRWPADKAARRIADGLDRRALEIAFPRPFIALLLLLAHLPGHLRLAVTQRMSRNPSKDDTR